MNSKKTSPLLLLAVLVGTGVLGWLLGRDAGSTNKPATENRPASSVRIAARPYDPPNATSKDSRQARGRPGQQDGIPNESLVHFGSEEAYRKFLASLDGSGLRLLGRLDNLRTLRLGFDNPNDLSDLLGADFDEFANYPVYVPEPPSTNNNSGGVGFGADVLAWLGITGEHSQFGAGVTIAIIDTGVIDHPSLQGIEQIDLVSELRGEFVPINPHGTSVASLIGGEDGAFSGIAPGAPLLSVRIGDEDGSANSFLLAEGIVRSVDAGASLINVSMGSDSDSAVVQMAIDYALENGALIIASAGNLGNETLSFPASNEGVIAVGAVDRASNQLGFSNSGDSLNVLAPGLEILAANEDGGYDLFSGTSASAPLLTGAIAATSTEMNIPLNDAYDLIVENLNEAGPPGPDPFYGNGILNLERVFNSNTSGIYDVALVSPYYQQGTTESPNDQLLFTVENRGTATVPGIELNITTDYGQIPYNVGTLAPNQIETYVLPINTATGEFSVQARVEIPGNLTDTNLSNNRAEGLLTISSESTSDPLLPE